MSKELEALKILKANAILFDDGTDFGASMLESITVLDKALTPPTADEVCKALSEQLKLKVSYGEKQFYYKIENTECVMFVTETYGNGLWSINDYLPPHLIVMIGRFYEGL